MFSEKDRFVKELLTLELNFDVEFARNRDSLDFKDLHVEVVKAALLKAFDKGAASVDRQKFYDLTKNPIIRLQENDVFNPFTTELKAKSSAKGPVLVELRDGSFEKVWFKEERDECSDPANPEWFKYFTCKSGRRWNANGTSYTTRDWDIVGLG